MLLTALLLAATLDVPRAAAPVIDGTVVAEEWKAAKRVTLTNGGEALLQHDGTFLYVAITAPRTGIASLCTGNIRVLHASAALGTAEFRDGHLTRDFVWTNRNTADLAARDKFLAAEGWFGSASPRGSRERELQLAIDERKEIPLTIAFMSFAEGEEPRMHVWPAPLADACTGLELASGDTKQRFTFEPPAWGVIAIR